MPTRAKTLTTSAAILLFFIGVLSIFLHIFDATKFPSPQSLETDILIGLSLITIFGLYFPWSRIKFGDWEIEAKVQKELNDREDVIASLGSKPHRQINLGWMIFQDLVLCRYFQKKRNKRF